MQKKQFPSPEFARPPIEKELLTQRKREKLDRRYDHLLAERDGLYKELEKYSVRDYQIIFNPGIISEKEFRELTDDWIKKTREQTEFFSILDRLGIEIFTDDLDKQPGFKDVNIVFDSKEIEEKMIVDLQEYGGYTRRDVPRIDIALPKPNLLEQMHRFYSEGTLPDAVLILIHELIHRYHFRENMNTEVILTEAQAYASGLLDSGTQFSLISIASALALPEKEKGLYQFDVDKIIEALRTIIGLSSLGKKQDEIAELVATSRFDYKKKMFIPLTEEYLKLKEKYKLDENDLQALDDIYRLHVNNQRLKARLALFQTLSEKYSKEELVEVKKTIIKKIIARPDYYVAGKKVPALDMMQRWVCPLTSDFPYEPDGKRTGIIFGLFGDISKSPHFEIGRLEAEGRDSKLELAQTDEEVNKYLDLLSKYFKNISFEQKDLLFREYVANGIYYEPKGIASQIIKILFNQEEKKSFILGLTPPFMEKIKIVEIELDKMNEFFNSHGYIQKKNIRNFGEYEAILDFSWIEELLDIEIENIDASFSDYVDTVKRKINELKAKALRKVA
ncbi:MAG: hypothetical protein ACOZBH_03735 [Patescibacteria group bacterium]